MANLVDLSDEHLEKLDREVQEQHRNRRQQLSYILYLYFEGKLVPRTELVADEAAA